ncbi:hypothetical protein Pla108_03270 [Botrimarina colliarenosi]|uniref:Putative restriction endonuclease domain-containing protein n=1 Tax=Botrimarina colliarenosi TaxID=2528001 RepID=A0A5C6AJ11_9BACT|nr:Uma2 family endonuclease [Botrimarina colliarenosi]TWT99390.1 hypothetical protein Pla108_03270 [Botrimarina colliarenosi]
MDTSVSTPLEPIVPTFPVKRFTADQYIEMIRTGILTEDDRVELIDGIITEMAPAGEEHTWEVVYLNRLFQAAWDTHFLFVQGTIPIGKLHVYDPDFVLVRQGGSEQRKRYPRADEIDLVVEVAKSSLKRDQTEKATAYSEAGIPEYWIADINAKTMIVHREPSPAGYQKIASFDGDATVTPLAFPQIKVRVGDVFGE